MSRTFGLTRDAPDEFQVTTRAPLSMPPEYTLRPPRPGASRPQEITPREGAQTALVPQTAMDGRVTGRDSSGQEAILAAAGPAVSGSIRGKIDADAAMEATDHSFADTLMFWHTPEDKSVQVDPQREASRLRTNSALGRAPTAGDTAIIQRKKSNSVVGSLFDSVF